MRSIFAFILVFVLSMLLITPAFAQTEDELVAKFLKKAEKQQVQKVGYIVMNGSLGRLFQDNDYNKFSVRVSPLVSSVTSGSSTAISSPSLTMTSMTSTSLKSPMSGILISIVAI